MLLHCNTDRGTMGCDRGIHIAAAGCSWTFLPCSAYYLRLGTSYDGGALISRIGFEVYYTIAIKRHLRGKTLF